MNRAAIFLRGDYRFYGQVEQMVLPQLFVEQELEVLLPPTLP